MIFMIVKNMLKCSLLMLSSHRILSLEGKSFLTFYIELINGMLDFFCLGLC